MDLDYDDFIPEAKDYLFGLDGNTSYNNNLIIPDYSPKQKAHMHEIYEDSNVMAFLTFGVFTALSVLSIMTNISFAYVILKFSKLRRDKRYLIYLNASLVNTLYLVTVPLIQFYNLKIHDLWNQKVLLILHHIKTICVACEMLFYSLLLINWWIKTHQASMMGRFQETMTFNIFSVHFISLATGILLVCIGRYSTLQNLMTFWVLYFNLGILLVVLQCLHLYKSRRCVFLVSENLDLNLASFFLVMWSPMVVSTIVGALANMLPAHVILLSGICYLIRPPLTVLLIYFCDNQFGIFVNSVLKCQSKQYENEEYNEHIVSYNNENPDQVIITDS